MLQGLCELNKGVISQPGVYNKESVDRARKEEWIQVSHAKQGAYPISLRESQRQGDQTVICPITDKETSVEVDIEARFIRVRITANQTSWITVSEFTAISEDHVSPLLAFDTDFVARTELLALTDGHYVSFFAPDEDKAEGHILKVAVDEGGKVKLITLKLPENGLNITVTDASGNTIKTVELSYVTVIEAPEGSVIHIPLGNGLMLAEVEW